MSEGQPLRWKVKVSKKVNWSYTLREDRRVLRSGRNFESQAEAAYAAGKATMIEIQSRANHPLLNVVCDWGDKE